VQADFGFADADYTFWLGLFAPAKTPRAILGANTCHLAEPPKGFFLKAAKL